MTPMKDMNWRCKSTNSSSDMLNSGFSLSGATRWTISGKHNCNTNETAMSMIATKKNWIPACSNVHPFGGWMTKAMIKYL